MNDNSTLQPSIQPIGPYKRRDLKSDKPRRIGATDIAGGLTRRQYHVLLLLSVYGWCTPRIVQAIAKYYGLPCERAWISEVLGLLCKGGFAIVNKTMNGTRELVYAASKAGLSAIHGGDMDTNLGAEVTRDPASLNHFLGVNRMFVGFLQEFVVNYWMSDFQVRADNSLYGNAGFAKDYDAVGEILVQNSPVRIGIEYELTLKSSTRYAELCATYATEKHLHLVIYVLNAPGMLNSIAPNFKEVGGLICFMLAGNFLASRTQATAHYWNNGNLLSGPLLEILKFVSKRPRSQYAPASQLRAADFTSS